MVVINGRFLGKNMQGIPRYVSEILKEIDKLVTSDDDVIVFIPTNLQSKVSFQNIHVRFENYKNPFQWDFCLVEKFARKHNALLLNMACGGLYSNSIVTIHDIRSMMMCSMKTETIKNYCKLYLLLKMATFFSRCIVTVSESVKCELKRFVPQGKNIVVTGNGWEHMNNIVSDDSVFSKYPSIKRKEYYLAISSIAPHKNYRWIIENATTNSDCQYVVVGGFNIGMWPDKRDELRNHNNIFYVGFQSDEVIKSLLLNAKALVFPTLYEGFGIPPLEAMACGTKVIVSDIPVMREIYGDSVEYLDPYDSSLSLDNIDWGKDRSMDIEAVLKKYTWANAAKKWYELMKEYM